MPSSVWKGSIVLSLVSIPIKLFAAARSERTFLHQLHTVCHSRLRQPLFCPTCERFVKRDEIVKGYEVEEGQYVLVQGEEIKKIAAKSSRILEILAFSKLNQISRSSRVSTKRVSVCSGREPSRLACTSLFLIP